MFINQLINNISKFIYYLLSGNTNSNSLTTNYKRINKPKISRVGYVDIEAVAKRYEKQVQDKQIAKMFKNPAVRDSSMFFLEKDCKDFSNDFNKVKKVLDIGCGTGTYSKIFRNRNIFDKKFKYFGTEISQIFIDLCKKENPKENFVLGYADNINFGNDFFDLIYCSSTLHYTLNKWKESLREMKRLTNKFIVMVRFPLTKYNKTFYVHQTVAVKDLNSFENHYFVVINRTDFENYLSKIGLKILKRDYSSEEYNIQGVSEKIILSQYLLQK